MGKLHDLKAAVASKLKANVPELADVDVIAHDERDISTLISTALGKVSGLCVVVMLTGGVDETEGQPVQTMDLRLESSLSVTIWSRQLLATKAGTPQPAAQQPLDVLEAVMRYLHNLNIFDLVPDPEGGPGSLRVLRWEVITRDEGYFVMEVTAEVDTQLPTTAPRRLQSSSGNLLSDIDGDPLNA